MATSFEYVVGRISALQKIEEIDTEETQYSDEEESDVDVLSDNP